MSDGKTLASPVFRAATSSADTSWQAPVHSQSCRSAQSGVVWEGHEVHAAIMLVLRRIADRILGSVVCPRPWDSSVSPGRCFKDSVGGAQMH